jgi:hypothetical protein
MHIKIIHFQVSFFYFFCRAARQTGGGACITCKLKLVFRVRESAHSASGFLQIIVTLCWGVVLLVTFYLADGRHRPIGSAGKVIGLMSSVTLDTCMRIAISSSILRSLEGYER